MIGIVLSGHGNFPTGMYSALKLIAGEQENFEVVDFIEGMGYEDLRVKLEAGVKAVNGEDGVVIFTDLQGGTPFNQSVLLSAQIQGVKVVAGTNLPLLLDASFKRDMPIHEFIDEIIDTAKDGVVEFVSKTLVAREDDDLEDGI